MGQMLKSGLSRAGYKVDVFDTYKGVLINLLRRRYLGTLSSSKGIKAAKLIKRIQKKIEKEFIRTRIITPTMDNILDFRSRLIDRFKEAYAVIHLAALPHPNIKGAIDEDFKRINYDGSVNVFEAAKEARVEKFIFASSAAAYGIIRGHLKPDQFPILESNYCSTREEGNTYYGLLKLQFEEYMTQSNQNGNFQASSMRMEFPGIISHNPTNFYISTSRENTVAGFESVLTGDINSNFEVFNLADAVVNKKIVDIQEFINERWPDIPNHTKDNECVLSTEKLQTMLGFHPKPGGTYYSAKVAW